MVTLAATAREAVGFLAQPGNVTVHATVRTAVCIPQYCALFFSQLIGIAGSNATIFAVAQGHAGLTGKVSPVRADADKMCSASYVSSHMRLKPSSPDG